jgi:hypothetical protein
MTREELEALTTDAINVRLATLLEPDPDDLRKPPRVFPWSFGEMWHLSGTLKGDAEPKEGDGRWAPLNFVDDIRSMQWAECKMPESHREDYVAILRDIVISDAVKDNKSGSPEWLLVYASSYQRAQAMILTLEAEPAPIPTT